MRSMTGFGAASAEVKTSDGGRRYVIELRSFNHRFVELKLRLPPQWNDALLDQLLGQALRKRIHRGSLIVSVRQENGATSSVRPSVQVSAPLLLAYRQALRDLRRGLLGSESADEAAEGSLDAAAYVAFVAAQPGVLRFGEESEDGEARFRELEPILDAAIAELVAARQREGAALAADLQRRLQLLLRLLDEVASLAEAAPGLQRRRLHERLTRLLDGSTPVDGQRLAQEVALLADRLDVSEEITRLRAHIAECLRLCQSDGVLGRQLEFLTQEMGREVNTIGSKSQSAEVASRVVAMKAELERLREQIQNVE
jgi:uncharacterized protein (TIGR00255 family)